MCDHDDGLDWEDIALAGALAEQIAKEIEDRKRLSVEIMKDEDQNDTE